MAEPPGLETAEHTGTDSLAVEDEEDLLVVGSFELWESVEDEEDWLVVGSFELWEFVEDEEDWLVVGSYSFEL